jgi:hypothetical protein
MSTIINNSELPTCSHIYKNGKHCVKVVILGTQHCYTHTLKTKCAHVEDDVQCDANAIKQESYCRKHLQKPKCQHEECDLNALKTSKYCKKHKNVSMPKTFYKDRKIQTTRGLLNKDETFFSDVGCLDFDCPGMLNDNDECDTCETVFCKQCHLSKKDGHKCIKCGDCEQFVKDYNCTNCGKICKKCLEPKKLGHSCVKCPVCEYHVKTKNVSEKRFKENQETCPHCKSTFNPNTNKVYTTEIDNIEKLFDNMRVTDSSVKHESNINTAMMFALFDNLISDLDPDYNEFCDIINSGPYLNIGPKYWEMCVHTPIKNGCSSCDIKKNADICKHWIFNMNCKGCDIKYDTIKTLLINDLEKRVWDEWWSHPNFKILSLETCDHNILDEKCAWCDAKKYVAQCKNVTIVYNCKGCDVKKQAVKRLLSSESFLKERKTQVWNDWLKNSSFEIIMNKQMKRYTIIERYNINLKKEFESLLVDYKTYKKNWNALDESDPIEKNIDVVERLLETKFVLKHSTIKNKTRVFKYSSIYT